MPQLEITTFPSQIFWLVVSFLMLYLIMSRIIIPRISFVIKKRETEIKNNVHIAEQIYEDTKIINDEFEKIKKETQEEARTIKNNLKEIIKAFTINNAKSIKKEREIGSIKIGKNADLIILNKNLSKLKNHNEILEVKVIHTIINGESKYRLN